MKWKKRKENVKHEIHSQRIPDLPTLKIRRKKAELMEGNINTPY